MLRRTITRRMLDLNLVFRPEVSDLELFNYVQTWAETRPWTVCRARPVLAAQRE